jgi:hypothetical protein
VTLAPLVNPTVHGVPGKPGILPFICATPGCERPAQQRHHLWSKSFLRGQPFEWVSVNGIVLQNSCGLCLGHHAEVTGGDGPGGGHAAKVVFNEGLQVLEWWESIPGDDWVCLGLLDGEEAPLIHATEASREREKEGLCPSCGRPHRKESKPLPKRKTKKWSVEVPDDAEDGALVLDEYVDDLSVALGFGDERKGVRRFHVLANVLLWVTQMKPEFLADWEEAGQA